MITAMLVGLLQLAAPSSSSAGPVDEVGGGDVVFTRVEPHLAAGARALAADDPDLALERYRRAEATTDEQRAVVEYNAGQALLLQAMKAAAAHEQQPSATPAAAGEPAAPPPPPDVGDALSSFERAASLGKAPSFISEARLAAGNAALVGNKLDDAIAQLRKALVADPRNERARHNLQRALELKQQQPPQQNDGDGDKSDDKEKDDKSDDKQKSDEQKNDKGDQKSDEQKNDKSDQKSDDQKNDKSDQKSDDQKNDKGEQKSDEQKNDKGDQQDEQQKPDGAAGEPKPAPKKPTSREEARRLLEGVRSREKPLSPIEMRGVERRPAENGKDW
jgi:hypothetical protein